MIPLRTLLKRVTCNSSHNTQRGQPNTASDRGDAWIWVATCELHE